MYPNSALAAWQLAVIALVAVGTLAIWLTAVYLAARAPRDHARETGKVIDVAPDNAEARPDRPAALSTVARYKRSKSRRFHISM